MSNLRLTELIFTSWRVTAHKLAQEKLFQEYQIEKKKEQVNFERAAFHDKVTIERK